MVIRSFSAINFRNINELQIEFAEGINVFFGNNGQGKTNLVECVYFANHLDSFRTRHTGSLIQNGFAVGHIQAITESDSTHCKITIELSSKGRKVWLDDQPVLRLSDYAGKFFSVVFNPENLFNFRHQPGERRLTFDRYLSFLEPGYISELKGYRHTHAQKNKLLKLEDRSSLADWNRLFAEKCYNIGLYRKRIVEALNGPLSSIHACLTDRPSGLHVQFNPSLQGEQAEFLDRISAAAAQESRAGFALYGAHRDDFLLTDGSGARAEQFSQGEYRLALLALKLAMSAHMTGQKAFHPILIFDDVFSELDQAVQERLIAYLQSLRNQIFITATDRTHGDRMPGARIMEIRDGKILDEERLRR